MDQHMFLRIRVEAWRDSLPQQCRMRVALSVLSLLECSVNDQKLS